MELSQHPPIHILLVESHDDSATVLQLLLERQGYYITHADSATTARELAAGKRFDLVISELWFPDDSGWNLIGALKALQPLKSIALTSLAMASDRAKSFAAGFDRHLNKPVHTEDLFVMIEELTTN